MKTNYYECPDCGFSVEFEGNPFDEDGSDVTEHNCEENK